MMQRMPVVMRLVATAVMVLSLIVVAVGPAAAQREPQQLTRAEQVRELVLKQREKVLAHIADILSGKKDKTRQVQDAAAAEDAAAAADGEPEDGEPEGGEPEDGEPEGDEGEEEDVSELPDTGVGPPRGADGALAALTAMLGALGAVGLGVRRRSV